MLQHISFSELKAMISLAVVVCLTTSSCCTETVATLSNVLCEVVQEEHCCSTCNCLPKWLISLFCFDWGSKILCKQIVFEANDGGLVHFVGSYFSSCGSCKVYQSSL